MRSSLAIVLLGVVVGAFVVSCGGGGGAGPDDPVIPDPVIPDPRTIVTVSSTSYVESTSYDNRAQNDTALTVKVLEEGDTPVLRPPNETDLVGLGDDVIGVPPEAGAGTTPADLLETIDLLRVSINPTGWWDDTNHLNPRAARPFQHGDGNAVYGYYRALGYAGTTSSEGAESTSSRYQLQPVATCVRLPVCTSSAVTENRARGVYTGGGKLYVFDATDHLGIFIVRRDGRLYVPAAFDKVSSGWRSFGDNWTEGYKAPGQANSINKTPQMTVSPDGRFAALKLRASSSYSRTELADSTAILLISLTGERIEAWGGAASVVIETGSDGSASRGQYQFASSLTLTNRYLYYLIGSGSTTYLSWNDHYIYRYDLLGGANRGAFLHPGHNSEWTNTVGAAMQTPFQAFSRDFNAFDGPDPQMVGGHGHNAYESSLAPHPFRVSADGSACAILAGRRAAPTLQGWEIRFHHVWVDYEGELHQLSNQRRHTSGGGRGIQLTGGMTVSPCAWQWGAYNGPTSRFEISDDGLGVAVVYTRYRDELMRRPWGVSDYDDHPYRYREDVVAYSTTPASPWDAASVHEITGDSSTSTSPATAVFQPSIAWRFGALTFTAEGDGLVYWGGYSNYEPTAYLDSDTAVPNSSKAFVGSLYSYRFGDQVVQNILASENGGANKTVGSALTSIAYSTSSWQTDGGVIKPIGGWVSPNHHFLYVVTKGALQAASGSRRDGSVIAVNVRSLDSGRSINARTDGRSYVLSGMDTTNGFYPVQYYIAAYGIGPYTHSALYQQYYQSYGDTQRVAATDNGWVYFVSEKATFGYTSRYASSTYGGCVNDTYYTYNYLTKHVYVFDQNVGGDAHKIAGDDWHGGTPYHSVGFLEVSDDGSQVAAVDSTDTYYDWNDTERLTVWSGIELDAAGNLVGAPTEDQFVSGGFVSSHVAFPQTGGAILYAAGPGNENQKLLELGTLGSGGATTALGLPASNYNVLHVGR